MISISNADRDKTVEFLRDYAALLKASGVRTLKTINQQRVALLLAKKLERKLVEARPDRKKTQPKK